MEKKEYEHTHKQHISDTEEAFDSNFYRSNLQLPDNVIWAAQWSKQDLLLASLT
jgi:hypothetical protein